MTSYQLPQEDTVVDILKQHGVARAQLFGSAARGELRDESDIDLLVAFAQPDTDYYKLLNLKEDLEKETQRDYDVMTKISPVFLPYIEAELTELSL